jgi:hypothetical protein
MKYDVRKRILRDLALVPVVIVVAILFYVFSCKNNKPKEKVFTAVDYLEMGKSSIKEGVERDLVFEIESGFEFIDSVILKYPNSTEAIEAKQILNNKKYYYFKKDSLKNTRIKSFNKSKADEEINSTDQRKLYGSTLNNFFLDRGWDIKVKVSGKNNTDLNLNYPLFSDLWFRKFETNGYFTEWSKIGFKKITMSNGNDFNKYISY